MRRDFRSDSLVSVVVPIYNEAENIRSFTEEVFNVLRSLSLPCAFELVICDDGSQDGSGEILDDVARAHPGAFRIVHLSRNFGHASAVWAGLDHARGDVIIAMDGDMQDDPAVFAEFIEKWRAGYDAVYAIRTSREERRAMRLLFWLFYRILRWMVNIDLPLDAGNFGLIDRRLVTTLTGLLERNVYFPGLRAWAGFRQIGVPAPRRARYDRKSRMGLRGLWSLCADAVFSFSYVPLFAFRIAGFLSIALSILLIIYGLAAHLIWNAPLSAFSGLLMTISFFGGVNLSGIAVLGEYIARIYDEVRGRPRYVVRDVLAPNAPPPKETSD